MNDDPMHINYGREFPLYGEHMGNLTARNAAWFYVARRLGDPLVHASIAHSSRTTCMRSVIDEDAVEPGSILELTCIECIVEVFHCYHGPLGA